LVPVARACLEAGAQRLCVVDMQEAVLLCEAGIEAPIVHVWATPPDELETAVSHNIIATIEDEQGARALSRLGAERNMPAMAHVAIETGTGWSGVPVGKVPHFASAVQGLMGIDWDGVWTHVAGRDSMPMQLSTFEAAVSGLRVSGLKIPHEHVASTGPTLWGAGGNAARIGIGLYGSTVGQPHPTLNLKTAVTLRSQVAYVKRFDRPTSLGYGGQSVAQPGEAIATLRLGYADGLPRTLSLGGSAYIRGARCPIVGAIGMNFTMVRIPDTVGVLPGDEAIALGDIEGVRLDEVAQRANMIPHQVVTSLAALSARASV
jgi:alanine racemase